jgi:hypothetical protein
LDAFATEISWMGGNGMRYSHRIHAAEMRLGGAAEDVVNVLKVKVVMSIAT